VDKSQQPQRRYAQKEGWPCRLLRIKYIVGTSSFNSLKTNQPWAAMTAAASRKTQAWAKDELGALEQMPPASGKESNSGYTMCE